MKYPKLLRTTVEDKCSAGKSSVIRFPHWESALDEGQPREAGVSVAEGTGHLQSASIVPKNGENV